MNNIAPYKFVGSIVRFTVLRFLTKKKVKVMYCDRYYWLLLLRHPPPPPISIELYDFDLNFTQESWVTHSYFSSSTKVEGIDPSPESNLPLRMTNKTAQSPYHCFGWVFPLEVLNYFKCQNVILFAMWSADLGLM